MSIDKDYYVYNYGSRSVRWTGKYDIRKNKDAARLHEMLCSWQQATAMLEAGEISKENYDKWRYHYPEFDTTDHWHKVVPSQGLSDLLVSALKDNKESEEVKK